MTTYPDWAAGDEISAAKLNDGQMHVIVKQSTETVTSSTTLQDDDELVVPLEANAAYYILFCLAGGGVAAGDIKTAYTVPSGATGLKFVQGPQLGSADRENTAMVTAAHNFTTSRNYGPTSTTSVPAEIEQVLVTTGSVAGNFQLQWAQNASSPTGSVMLAGSFVAWVRVA